MKNYIIPSARLINLCVEELCQIVVTSKETEEPMGTKRQDITSGNSSIWGNWTSEDDK